MAKVKLLTSWKLRVTKFNSWIYFNPNRCPRASRIIGLKGNGLIDGWDAIVKAVLAEI